MDQVENFNVISLIELFKKSLKVTSLLNISWIILMIIMILWIPRKTTSIRKIKCNLDNVLHRFQIQTLKKIPKTKYWTYRFDAIHGSLQRFLGLRRFPFFQQFLLGN